MALRKYFLPVFCVLIIGGISWQCANLYHRFNNTLFKSGNWVSSKTKVENTLIGAAAFLSTRNALSNEQLNLGVWHGGHEVLSSQEFDLLEVTFDFWLSPGGYIAFLYDHGPRETSGVHFSSASFVANKALRADPRGEFTGRANLSLPSLGSEKWHQAKITFSPGRAQLSLNGSYVSDISALKGAASRIGFRGSVTNSSVDNVLVKQKSGQQWFESFSLESLRRNAFAASFLALMLLFACVLIVAGQSALVGLSFNFVCIFLFVAAANYFDRAYFVNKYFAEPTFIERALHKDARGKYSEHVENSEDVFRRLNLTYFRDYNAKDFQVLFLGSSQTWGTGATVKNDAIPKQFEEKLKRLVPHRNITVDSAAVPGHRAWDQGNFLQHFEMKPPDMVVFNMSYNDARGDDSFEKHVRRIAGFCKDNNIQLVLVKEAADTENLQLRVVKNHRVLETVGQELGYPVLDLHGFMHSKIDSGFVWWDAVHMTSYGMAIAADFLSNQLAPIISTPIRKHD